MRLKYSIAMAVACLGLTQLAEPTPITSTPTLFQNSNLTVEGPINYCGADTGSANIYICANLTGATIKAYQVGNTYSFLAIHANTGASTLAIDGLTAVTIKKLQGTADLQANDIVANAMVKVVYDGTYFEMLTPTATGGSLATLTTPGIVEPDGSTITISNGKISSSGGALATLSAPGIVQPDGSTITISNGKISTANGGSSSTTLNAAAQYGAVGDGTLASFSNSSLPAGSTSFSGSWPAPAPVVGDALVIYFAGTPTAGANSQGTHVLTTITGVSGSTVTWATPTTGALSNTSVSFFYGHDNTNMLNAWANACSNTPEARCYLPAGVYLTHGHHVIYGAIQVYGDGMANTIIKDIDPAQDVLLLKNALSGKTLLPQSWQPGAYVHDIGFTGVGMETSGSLLVVDNSQMTSLEHLFFAGHGGPGLNLYSGERVKMEYLWFSETKRAIINSEATINETSLNHFDIQSDGCVSDNQGPSGAYYNNNVNAVNGVMPTSGSIIENYRAAITLYSVADFTINDGSIKPSLCNGGIMITDSVHTSEISHVYFENAGGNPAFSVIFGGPWIESTLATELTPASAGGDLVDGSWMPDLIGNIADATGNNFYPAALRPPDYVAGDTTDFSSICNASCQTSATPIYKGTVEFVYIKWILHDTVGSGWHPSYNARHLSGSTYSSTAVDWPAGAVFVKQYNQASAGPLELRGNNHNFAGSVPNGLTLNCNDETGQVCGEVSSGIWPGVLNVPGSSHFVNQARGIYFDGSGKMGTGSSPADGTVEAPNSAWFLSTGSYNYQPFTNTTATGGTTNTTLPISVGTGSAQLRRATYPNTSGSGPDVKYQDASHIIEMNNAQNPNSYFPAGKMEYNSWGIGSSMNAAVTNYLWAYAFNDSYSCGSSNTPCYSEQLLGSDSMSNAGGPGKRTRVYGNGGLGTVERDFLPFQSAVTANGGSTGVVRSLNLGDTKPTAGLTLNNALSLLRVPTLTSAPTITPQGTAGTSTYSYCVAAFQYDGTHTACTPIGSTSTGNATLSATNYNQIKWGTYTGYANYFQVFCTQGCGSVGIVNPAPLLAGTSSYNDITGTVVTPMAAPTSNNTGSLIIGDTNINGTVAGDTALGIMDVFGSASLVRVFDDGGLALIPTGTQTTCSATNRGEMWTTFGSNAIADSFQICQRTVSGSYAWSSVGGGSLNSVSVNNGTPCTITNGNCNLTLPPLVAAPNSGLSFVTSGGNINASTVTPVDEEAAGSPYTVPASDCTANGGFLVIGLTGSGSETISFGQPSTGGNFQVGCSVTVLNAASGGSVTVSTNNATFNGQGTITIGASSGGTWHSAKIISADSSHYVVIQQ